MRDADLVPAHGMGRWRVSPAATVPHDRRGWLMAGGALTLHLARLAGRPDAVERAGTSAYPVTVRVIKERRERPWPDEAPLLGAKARSVAWVREVELSVEGVPCVVAHSVTGLVHSRGTWRAMRTLRTRPLAILLYRDPTVRRSMLTSRGVGRTDARRADPLARLYARQQARVSADARPLSAAERDAQSPRSSRSLIARRSVFERHGAPLIITECFLPAFWQLLDRAAAR